MNLTNEKLTQPHIAICPSSGMGHLAPFLRLSSLLASCSNFKITLVIMHPVISMAESDQISNFFSTNPHVSRCDFNIPPSNCSNTSTNDPFFLQFEAITSSAHLLGAHLSTLTPPISAVFSDLFVTKGINNQIQDLGFSNYTMITTSAKFFCVMAYLPHLLSKESSNGYDSDTVEIPGIDPIPRDNIPHPTFDPNHLFTQFLVTNSQWLHQSTGIILNTFDFFETKVIASLSKGEVLSSLPPIFPIGPHRPNEMKGVFVPWLDEQPVQSVVYVCFGSRTAMTKDKIRELGHGLEKSGYRFLWVIKTSKVDKEEQEDLIDVLGEEFFVRTENKGVVLNSWVAQDKVLAHPSIGGFVNHCGWNSVMEAAHYGIPMLAWPQHGDQKVNAGIVEKAGLGIWERGWGWTREDVVKREVIAEKVKEVMGNEKLRTSARKVGEEAQKACQIGGSSEKRLMQIVKALNG